MRQVIWKDAENGLVREGSQEYNADENGGLPLEIWTLNLQYSTIQDPSKRYNLMRVCRLFYNTIRSMPLPEIYISPNLIRSVPRQVSVRRFIRIAGRNSGLVLQIRNIVRNSRWINAWIRLQERNHGWFFITDVWWRHS